MELGENMHTYMRYLFLQEFQVTHLPQTIPGPILRASMMMMEYPSMGSGNLKMHMRPGSMVVTLILLVSYLMLKMIMVFGSQIAFPKNFPLMNLIVETSG